jgi:glycosyltransferase involved in cell wall biosynthesis
MHLAHIVPSLEERHGGPSKSVRAIASALALTGNSVELLTTAPIAAEPEMVEQLTIETFRRDWPRKLCPSRGLRERITNGQADIVHHHSLWLRTLHYAHSYAARRHVPLVVSPRGMMSRWSWEHHRLRKKFARQFIHPGAFEAVSGWHATSKEEAEEIAALGFKQPVCVAPNGVAPPEPEAINAAGEFWRKECPQLEGQRVALFYSRFHEKKRVIELIDLWLECAPKEWTLLLVGVPESFSVQILERYVLRNSGGGRVRVFDGSGKPPPYAVASLFLLPSHSENFGLVIAEAMAHGLATIVTDTTPWRGLTDTGGGACVPWIDFGATMVALMSESRQKLRARGMLARAWALREFSWENSARLLGDFYGSLPALKS